MTAFAMISVTLIHDEGDGVLFLADVCTMLERVAHRIQVPFAVVSTTTTTRVYGLDLEPPRELQREAGLHRAQLVPDKSVLGRVVTARVMVTVSHTQDALRDRSIKTYSYVTKRVTFHETGEVVPLDEVLSGAK